jgi:Protein of unknown function (DUF3800)
MAAQAAFDVEDKLSVADALPEDYPTATIYLDESGVIKTDRFFGIGCLRAGPDLSRALGRYRQKLECFDEIHWSRFDKAAAVGGRLFDLGVAAIDTFFDLEDVSFCCTVADRQNGDLLKSYRTGWKAYEGLSIGALEASIGERELVSVMADHVDTPPHVRFEEAVAAGLNRSRGRLTVTTVTRLHSHAVDGLQLADLLLGAAMFDFRRGAARERPDVDSQKAKLSEYLLRRCDIPTFRPGGKDIDGKIKVAMRRRKRTRRGKRGGDPTGAGQ